MDITLDQTCITSEDVVARIIEDELIIVPLTITRQIVSEI